VTETKKKVFVSYARADLERVSAWVSALEAATPYDFWWDPKLRAGDDFVEAIGEQLENADCVLVVWSPAANKSRWVKDEARVGDRRGVLVPVSLEGVEAPLGWGSMHVRDLSRWQPGTPLPPALLDDLARTLGGGAVQADRAPPKAPSASRWNSDTARKALLAFSAFIIAALAAWRLHSRSGDRPALLPSATTTDSGVPRTAQLPPQASIPTAAVNQAEPLPSTFGVGGVGNGPRQVRPRKIHIDPSASDGTDSTAGVASPNQGASAKAEIAALDHAVQVAKQKFDECATGLDGDVPFVRKDCEARLQPALDKANQRRAAFAPAATP